jgi:hypothetical protein
VSLDLRGINNVGYFTDYYLKTAFEDDLKNSLLKWTKTSVRKRKARAPWLNLYANAQSFFQIKEEYLRTHNKIKKRKIIRELAKSYLISLEYSHGYRTGQESIIPVSDGTKVPVFYSMDYVNGVWWLLVDPETADNPCFDVLKGYIFDSKKIEHIDSHREARYSSKYTIEEMINKIFRESYAPRFLIFTSLNTIYLFDRNKWHDRHYISFDATEIFNNMQESTFKVFTVLLHHEQLNPIYENSLLDTLDCNSKKHAKEFPQKFRHVLRDIVEILGDEIVWNIMQGNDDKIKTFFNEMKENYNDLEFADSRRIVNFALNYLYELLICLYIESNEEYKNLAKQEKLLNSAYSIAQIKEFLCNNELTMFQSENSLNSIINDNFELLHNGFLLSKENRVEIGDLSYTSNSRKYFNAVGEGRSEPFRASLKNLIIRNDTIKRIFEKLTIIRDKEGNIEFIIDFTKLHIEDITDAFESFLLYEGFVSKETVYEVKASTDKVSPDTAGYFVNGEEFSKYKQSEQVSRRGQIIKHDPYQFIFRPTIRTLDQSTSYFMPKQYRETLIKYALKKLLKNKSADEILNLTIFDPAVGAGSLINEAVNQIANAYLIKKQEELNDIIADDKLFDELRRVKAFITKKNVYGIDFDANNRELAKKAIAFNTIFDFGYMTGFKDKFFNANSIAGAQMAVISANSLRQDRRNYLHYPMPNQVTLKKGRLRKNDELYAFLFLYYGMLGIYNNSFESIADNKTIQKIEDLAESMDGEYTDNEIKELFIISNEIDALLEAHINALENHNKLLCDMPVFGRSENDYCISEAEQNKLIHEMCENSQISNESGLFNTPYKKLKCIMDYWCALWCWPLDKYDVYPTEQEYISHIKLILGIESPVGETIKKTSKYENKKKKNKSWLNISEIIQEVVKAFKFFHWELEFADIIFKNGGFDLIVCDPPWEDQPLSERLILSNFNPIYHVQRYTAEELSVVKSEFSKDSAKYSRFVNEYYNTMKIKNITAECIPLPTFKDKVPTNKHFLIRVLDYINEAGVGAMFLPDLFFDINSIPIYEKIYTSLCYYFQFENVKDEFPEIYYDKQFSMNIFAKSTDVNFESISNLNTPKLIENCYENFYNYKNMTTEEKMLAEQNGTFDRVVRIGKNELKTIGSMCQSAKSWREVRLPPIYNSTIIDVLGLFGNYKTVIQHNKTTTWYRLFNDRDLNENEFIERHVWIPKSPDDVILYKTQIGVANPMFKTARNDFKTNRDYDCVDLTTIPDDYLPRVVYKLKCSKEMLENEIENRRIMGTTPSALKNLPRISEKLLVRDDLTSDSERRLVACMILPSMMHTNPSFAIEFYKKKDLLISLGCFASLPFDFFAKFIDFKELLCNMDTIPVIDSKYNDAIIGRALMLNCITNHYASFWESNYNSKYFKIKWAKVDKRLNPDKFRVTKEWISNAPLRSDFERRQALVEIDVLTSMALGLTLEQLKIIYRFQFKTLKKNEDNTWYDQNGRIVYTINSNSSGVGIPASERDQWDNIKRLRLRDSIDFVIEDDSQGVEIKKTIMKFYPPFEVCDREKDYEIVWGYFKKVFTVGG